MKKIIRLSESELHGLVKSVINEYLGYDDWKTATPWDDYNDVDVEVKLRIWANRACLRNWDDCDVQNITEEDDGVVSFEVSTKQTMAVSKYEDENDALKDNVKDIAIDFIKAHGGADEYDIIDYNVI